MMTTAAGTIPPARVLIIGAGAAGLQALDYLDKGQTALDSWKTQQLAVIEQAKTRQADMLLMVVAPVQQLVEASAGQAQTK